VRKKKRSLSNTAAQCTDGTYETYTDGNMSLKGTFYSRDINNLQAIRH